MQTDPGEILARFDQALKQRGVPIFLHQEYRKWLRYFLDFRGKYPLPSEKSAQVKLFSDKLRSKGQTLEQESRRRMPSLYSSPLNGGKRLVLHRQTQASFLLK